MTQNNLISFDTPAEDSDALAELIRNGARDLIAQSVEADLAEMLERLQPEKRPRGDKRLSATAIGPTVTCRLAFPHDEPDRIGICHREAVNRQDRKLRQPENNTDDGVQTDGKCAAQLAPITQFPLAR